MEKLSGTPLKKNVRASPQKSPIKSKNGSVKGTPKKSPMKSQLASVKGTPMKSPMKNSMVISSTADLPESIFQSLEAQGIMTFAHLQGKTVKDLQSALEPAMFKPATDTKQELAQKMQKEILAAWLRFLVGKANGQMQVSSWRECIDPKRLQGQTAQNMLEAEFILRTLRPKQLIKQRSALKKVQKPRSKRIDHEQLKLAKNSLVKIPRGEALAKKVSSDLLSNARKSLKQVKK